MEDLLRGLNSKVQELTFKLESMSIELNTVKKDLSETRSDCKFLRDELSGFAADDWSSNTCSGLAERSSTKQILEEILFEVKSGKSYPVDNIETENSSPGKSEESKTAPQKINSLEHDPDEVDGNDNQESSQELLLNLNSLQQVIDNVDANNEEAKTRVASQQYSFWLEEITKLKRRLLVPVEGVTMTTKFMKTLEEKYVTIRGSISLSNYTNFELSSTGIVLHRGRLQPVSIPGQTKDLIRYRHRFAVSYRGSPITDALYYQIGSTGVVLYASFVLPPKGTKGFCSLTLTKKRVSYDRSTRDHILNCGSFSGMEHAALNIKGNGTCRMRDFGTLGRIVVKCNSIVAMAALSKIPGSNSLQLDIDLMEYFPESGPMKSQQNPTLCKGKN